MGVVVVGLVILVAWLASRSPAPSENLGALGPDLNVSALGATDKFSPALTGGLPLITRSNRVRLSAMYRNVDGISMPRFDDTPPAGTSVGVFGGLTNADSDGGYKRETSPAVVRPDPNASFELADFKF